jgi:leader peptidase (prepilin peptidase)/N-methyltransferase
LAPIAIAPIAGWFAAPLLQKETESNEPRRILVAAGFAVVAVWAALTMPANWLLPATCLLGWTLFALATVDALALRLPDIFNLPLIAAGLLVSLKLGDPLAHAIGAAAGFLVFYAIQFAYQAVRKREGLGLGDAKLAAAAGAWLGWQALPGIVLIACAVAVVWIGVAVIRRGRTVLEEQIPFGVPLCLAIWIVWLYGLPGLLDTA